MSKGKREKRQRETEGGYSGTAVRVKKENTDYKFNAPRLNFC